MDRRPTNNRVRYAVVGLGHISQVAILPAFANAPNSELFALVSGDSQKLEKLGAKYKLSHLYSYADYGRALSNVDAVYIALPNHLHCDYALRAAAAGVHVLCEKPMAVTRADCVAMMKSCHRNRVKLMIAYRLHFEAGNLEAIEIANSGRLGELRIFTSEFSQQVADDNVRVTEPPSRGGGVLYDMGVYCINASRYLFRAEPLEIAGFAASNRDARFKRVEEMISVVMRFPGERLGTFTCSFGATDASRYTILGTKGSVRADPAYEYAEGIELEISDGGKTTSKIFPKCDQFAAELAYFSKCILQNEEPQPSGFEGVADIRIIEAIYESIRTKRPVPVLGTSVRKRPTPSQMISRRAHGKPEVFHAKPASREAA